MYIVENQSAMQFNKQLRARRGVFLPLTLRIRRVVSKSKSQKSDVAMGERGGGGERARDRQDVAVLQTSAVAFYFLCASRCHLTVSLSVCPRRTAVA